MRVLWVLDCYHQVKKIVIIPYFFLFQSMVSQIFLIIKKREREMVF